MEKGNNQPHMVLFFDEDDEDCLAEQHFISVQQGLIMETSTIVASVFFCIAAHYIFNLSYHTKTGDVWVFIQEKFWVYHLRQALSAFPQTLPTSVVFMSANSNIRQRNTRCTQRSAMNIITSPGTHTPPPTSHVQVWIKWNSFLYM